MRKAIAVSLLLCVALFAADWPTLYPAAADDAEWNAGDSAYDAGAFSQYAGSLGGSRRNVVLRFATGGTGLSGATITSCVLNFLQFEDAAGSPSVRFYMVHEQSPAAPTSHAEANALTRTTNYVAWEPGTLTAWTRYNSPDLKDVLQEVVTAHGDLGAIIIIIEDQLASGFNYFTPASTNWAEAIPDLSVRTKLDISYTTGGGAGAKRRRALFPIVQ